MRGHLRLLGVRDETPILTATLLRKAVNPTSADELWEVVEFLRAARNTALRRGGFVLALRTHRLVRGITQMLKSHGFQPDGSWQHPGDHGHPPGSRGTA